MIKRMQKRRMYVPLSVDAARYAGMQPDQLGVYANMLAHPDGWEFREKQLAEELGVSEQRIGEILRVLETLGFTRRRQGRFGLVWDLYEAPEFEEEPPKPEPKPIPPEPKPIPPTPNPPETGKRTLTNEQMAKVFFEKAAELKRLAQEKRVLQEKRTSV